MELNQPLEKKSNKLVEGTLPTNMFKSIRNKDFSKNMFCSGLICLKTNAKSNIFFSKLPNLDLSDEIIVVVFSTEVKCLVLNRQLDFYCFFLDNNTILERKHVDPKILHGMQSIIATVHHRTQGIHTKVPIWA